MSNVVTLEQLGQEFTSLFRRRVFRLETLDYYDAENEREPYRRFLAGEPVDPAWREPWKKLVREMRDAGRIMQRVQIVSEPPSDYERFALLHGKPASVEAGEDVRILGRGGAEYLDVAAADFWMFDDDLVAVLVYRDGKVDHVDMLRRPASLRDFRSRRDIALWLATSLDRYVTENHITERKHAA